MISPPVALGFAVGASLTFGLGVAYAVARRAMADYKRTKAAVPGMRKDAWSAVRATIKAAGWISFAALCLVAWMISEARS